MLREGIFSSGSSSGDSVGSTVTIGSYNVLIEKKLADGGYAVVYLARDSYSSQLFALKRVLIRDKEHEQIVMSEVTLWRKLGSHPNIVKFIGGTKGVLANGNRVFWILCQLCSGGHLVDLMEKYGGALQQKQCLYILRETARGIKLMHDQQPPIAHRDIKIENILLQEKRFKLCDFGSATVKPLNRLDASEDDVFEAYQEFEKYTTMMYRPPEMCDRYLNYNVNEKADIWMLGCVAFTIAFARHPFEEQQKLAIINSQYIMGEGVSEKYKDLIRFMLTPSPQQRPSIAEVLIVLENWELSTISLTPTVRKIKMEQQTRAMEKGTVKDHERDLTEEEMYRLRHKILEEQKQKQAKGKISIAPNQSNMQTLIKQSMLQDRKVQKKLGQPAKQKQIQQPSSQASFNFLEAAKGTSAKVPSQMMKAPVQQSHGGFDFDFGLGTGASQQHSFDFTNQAAHPTVNAFNFGDAPSQAVSGWSQLTPAQAPVSFDPFGFGGESQAAPLQTTAQSSGTAFDFGGGAVSQSSQPAVVSTGVAQSAGPLLQFGGEEETTRPLSILEQLGGVNFGESQ